MEIKIKKLRPGAISDLCWDCCGIRGWVLAGSNHEKITTGTLGCLF